MSADVALSREIFREISGNFHDCTRRPVLGIVRRRPRPYRAASVTRRFEPNSAQQASGIFDDLDGLETLRGMAFATDHIMKSAIESVGAYAQAERAAGWQTFVAAWARRARKTATALWARARDRYEAYRLRMVAETLYTELSKLSDADLERRGMARGDLYRLTRAMTER